MAQRTRNSDKRERILQAAVKVFAAKGFYRARVSDVAREAGVADGTIYIYFASKEDLLRGLFEENMTRIIGTLREAVAAAETASDALRRAIETYVGLVEANPELAEVLTVELRESGKFMDEFAAPLFGEFLRVLVGVVEAGQSRGELRAGFSPRTIARAVFGALDELALAWVMSTSKWDLEKAGQELLDVFLGGMAVAGAGKRDAGISNEGVTAA